jgi:tRNA-specific adenosine deaminase 1
VDRAGWFCSRARSGLPPRLVVLGLPPSPHYPSVPSTRHADARFRCISLGTGIKCLPKSKVSSDGKLLHDSHAEVIARRALHR